MHLEFMAAHALEQLRDGLKAWLNGGMLFEELGFRYFGPIDGHDLPSLRRWLRDLKNQTGPVLLHVLTRKGHGVPQASADPVTYHTPPVFEKIGPDRTILALKRGGSKAYTDAASAAIYQAMQANPMVVAITAAAIARGREHFPEQPQLWIVSGGGRRNRTLMAMIAARVESAVAPAEAAGFDGDAIEAEAWAYLAVRSLKGLAISFPGTTGVSAPMTGGVLCCA